MFVSFLAPSQKTGDTVEFPKPRLRMRIKGSDFRKDPIL